MLGEGVLLTIGELGNFLGVSSKVSTAPSLDSATSSDDIDFTRALCPTIPWTPSIGFTLMSVRPFRPLLITLAATRRWYEGFLVGKMPPLEEDGLRSGQ